MTLRSFPGSLEEIRTPRNCGLISLLSYHCVSSMSNIYTPLENLTDDAYCLAVCDDMFDQFPLFNGTLHHIELC